MTLCLIEQLGTCTALVSCLTHDPYGVLSVDAHPNYRIEKDHVCQQGPSHVVSRISEHRRATEASKGARTPQPWQSKDGAPEGRLDDEGGGCKAATPGPFQLRKLAGTQKHARFADLQDEQILQISLFCGAML